MKIFCIMSSGLPLSAAASDALFRTAHQMVRQEKSCRKLTSDDIQGEVRTQFQRARLCSVSGLTFEADVITEKGQTKVKFLIRDNDLEGIETVQWSTLEELAEKYRRKTSRPSRIPKPSDN